MKKSLLMVSAMLATLSMSAQEKTVQWDGTDHTVKPVMTMTVVVDGETERTFNFGAAEAGKHFAVDFGDGNLVVTDEIGVNTASATVAAASGVAKGEGVITVYAENAADIWLLSTATGSATTSNIKAIDLNQLSGLNQLTLSGSELATVDLKGCTSLTNITMANGKLQTVDFSVCPTLTNITVTDNDLESINVNGLNALTNLNIGNNLSGTNHISTLDVSNLPVLGSIFANKAGIEEIKMEGLTTKLGSLYLNDNKLAKLIIPCEVGSFEAKNNKIAEFSVKDATKSCALDGNCMTIGTLPTKPAGLSTASKTKKFTYSNQTPLALSASYESGMTIDLSSELTATGELTEPATTTYKVADANGDWTVDTDYKVSETGVVTLLKSGEGVYVSMSNAAFPKVAAFTTSTFSVTEATVDRADLINAINSAEAMYKDNKESEAVANLPQAIKDANAALNSTDQNTINLAVAAICDAIDTAQNAIATSINGVAVKQNGMMYNIQGVQLNGTAKGVYIMNGKKYIK